MNVKKSLNGNQIAKAGYIINNNIRKANLQKRAAWLKANNYGDWYTLPYNIKAQLTSSLPWR